MTWLVKTRFGGSSWLGGDTGKVRYAPDIGSFSPGGEEYWAGWEKFFKFPVKLAQGLIELPPASSSILRRRLSSKRDSAG
jgi:hypothetical protein